MGYKSYLDSIKWLPVYINSVDTCYKISNTGLLRFDDMLIEEPYIYIGNKAFKIDRDYVLATMYIDNPTEHNSVRINGNVEWYTNKDLIKDAIIIEEKFFKDRISMDGNMEDRVRYACELMSNPEFRLPYVCRITGISEEEMYRIRMGDKWNDISRNYIFPIRNYTPGGSNYTFQQINEVCRMLSNEKSFKQILIQRITGVNPYTIDLIRYHKAYQMISMFYEFYAKDSVHLKDYGIYTPQQVRHACYMLESRAYEYNYIANFCNMDIDTLYKIRDKIVFTGISKDFNIRTNDESMYISRAIELISRNLPIRQITTMLQLEFNINSRKEVQQSIYDIRSKYFNVNGSTTISEESRTQVGSK